MLDITRLLGQVSKPVRYMGGEWNSRQKPWDSVAFRVAIAYPEVYEIGMSNQGIGILYHLLNERPDTLAERVFTPWVDMEALLRQTRTPLFSLESRQPLGAFDMIGFSLGYELKYTNVLTMLDLAGLPLRASQRDSRHPLIIAGGSCALNPEPMSPFIDAFVLGEGEEVIQEIADAWLAWKAAGPVADPLQARLDLLLALARIPGVYVPRFYRVSYHDDGTIAEIAPTVEGVPDRIRKRVLRGLPPLLTRPVVPYMQVVHDRAAMEIMRGCTRGCRFCQAGNIYRPMRYRSVEEMVQAAREIIANTGFTELALLSLSSMDHPEIAELCRALADEFRDSGVSVSMPSTRVDRFNVDLADVITFRKRTSLTFAPEGGTERMRNVISKNVSEEELLETVETAFSRGWVGLKLYFMVGLPTETLEDVQGIVDLAHKALAIGKRHAGGRTRIAVGVSTHIPKPHTPFQWTAQVRTEDLVPRQQLLQQGIGRTRGIHFTWNDPQVSLIEGLLSRGDRRVAAVIEEAWRRGARFDAWEEHFRPEAWAAAAAAAGVDMDWYNHRERDPKEVLPWAHIDAGIGMHYLLRDYRRAWKAQESPDCMYGACYACGIHTVPDLCHKAVPPPPRAPRQQALRTLAVAAR